MTARQTHIIGRTSLEVEVDDRAQAREWQERLSRFANGPLAGRLGELFDRRVGPGEVLRLENLEVTAEMTRGENWEAKLLDTVVREVAGALSEKQHTPGPKQHHGEGAVLVSSEESLIAAFFYFLKTGQLPWSASSEVAGQFEEKLRVVLGGEMGEKQGGAFRRIIQSPQVRERLVSQFSGETLIKVVACFLGKAEKQIAPFLKMIWAAAQKTTTESEALESVFWGKILAEPGENLTVNLHAAVAAHFSHHPEKWAAFAGFPAPLSGLNALSDFAKQNPKKHAEWRAAAKKAPEVFEGIFRQILREGKVPEKVAPRTGGLGEVVRTDKPVKERPAVRPYFLPETETYVRNAGLVVLHPFLPFFFEGLGIAKNKKIVQPHRAVHLLQFLATGQAGAMEHELPFNKLLCGLPAEMPVHRRIDLTEEEKTEAEKMLGAVIGHWSALGKTSVEGLRGTFLLRVGKYTKSTGGGWRLQVEKRAFDILLAQLPWSIARVQLPWMPEPLWVEW